MQEGMVCRNNYKITSGYKRTMELGGPLEQTSQSVFYLIKKQCPSVLKASASDTSQSLLCHETVTIEKLLLKLNTICLSVIPTYLFQRDSLRVTKPFFLYLTHLNILEILLKFSFLQGKHFTSAIKQILDQRYQIELLLMMVQKNLFLYHPVWQPLATCDY